MSTAAIIAVFEVPGMTADQYDQTANALAAAGLDQPEGRLYHVACAKEGGWLVVDVWESGDRLNQFAQTLVPILQQAGVTPPQPQIYPVHNIIKG
jgi:hypothetical protein